MTILVCPLQASMLLSHSTCIRTTMSCKCSYVICSTAYTHKHSLLPFAIFPHGLHVRTSFSISDAALHVVRCWTPVTAPQSWSSWLPGVAPVVAFQGKSVKRAGCDAHKEANRDACLLRPWPPAQPLAEILSWSPGLSSSTCIWITMTSGLHYTYGCAWAWCHQVAPAVACLVSISWLLQKKLV